MENTSRTHLIIEINQIQELGLIPCYLIHLIKINPSLTKNDLLNHLQSIGIPWFEKSYETKVFQIMNDQGYPPFDY